MAGLVTGVAGLRLEADAVLDLWPAGDGPADGDAAAARQEILGTAERVTGWYDGLATTLITGGELPRPLAHDTAADGRLVRAGARHRRAASGRPHHRAASPAVPDATQVIRSESRATCSI